MLHYKNGCIVLFSVCLRKTRFDMFYADYLTPALLSNVISEHCLGVRISVVFNPSCVTEGGLQDSVADSYRNISSVLLQQKIPF